MRKAMAVVVLAAFLLANAETGAAQSQGWAITPFGGYGLPLGNLVEYNDPSVPEFLQVEPTGGLMAGVGGELSLNKSIAVSAFAAGTFGLTHFADYHFRIPGASYSDDVRIGMGIMQLGGTVVLRPLGRLPNGAPKLFFLEAGVGLNMFKFAEVSSAQDTTDVSWSATSPIIVLGGGLTFRIGPRSTAVVFARYNMAMSEYSSAGLDDWNGTGTAAQVDPGQKVNVLFVGVGLRTGR